MPFRTFLLADAFSSLFTIAVMTGSAMAGGNSLQVILKDISRIGHLAVVAALAVITALLLVRYFRGRRITPR